MSDVKNYVLVKDGKEEGTFTGRNPRQAALKAANRGNGTKDKPETIKLRETGTKKLHVFNGYKMTVKSPEKRPAWVPEMVNKPFVSKVGVEKLEGQASGKKASGKKPAPAAGAGVSSPAAGAVAV